MVKAGAVAASPTQVHRRRVFDWLPPGSLVSRGDSFAVISNIISIHADFFYFPWCF